MPIRPLGAKRFTIALAASVAEDMSGYPQKAKWNDPRGDHNTVPRCRRRARSPAARRAGSIAWAVAAHSIAETYAVLTTLPVKPKISAALALRLIRENIVGSAEIVALSTQEYLAAATHLAETGILGGAVYNALLALSAEKAGATRILTLNGDDFRRVWPSITGLVELP